MEKKTILVVDDDSQVREFLNDFLTAKGFNVIVKSDSLAALSYLAKYSVNLIITDLNMPNLDGFDLIDKVIRVLDMDTTPIILMSGLTSPIETKQKDYLLHENLIRHFFKKPFKLNKLFEKINEILL